MGIWRQYSSDQENEDLEFYLWPSILMRPTQSSDKDIGFDILRPQKGNEEKVFFKYYIRWHPEIGYLRQILHLKHVVQQWPFLIENYNERKWVKDTYLVFCLRDERAHVVS